MSKEWMQKTLAYLGFTKNDAQVYVYLSTEDPKKAKDIAEALNLDSSQLCRIIKKLQINGLLNVSLEYPSRFSAVIFEKVLENLIKAKRDQHNALLASKEDLISTWKLVTEKDDDKS